MSFVRRLQSVIALVLVHTLLAQPMAALIPGEDVAPAAVAAASEWVRVATVAASTKAHDVLKSPAAIAIAPTGDVYVADTAHHQIRVIRTGGAVEVLAGTGAPGDDEGAALQARLRAPAGIAFDAALNVVYVADTGNHRIKRLTSDGRIEHVAGSGRPGLTDGSGASADFHQPAGLALAANGDLYVADTLNHAIRRISGGAVSTVAGAGRPGWADGGAAAALFQQPASVAVAANGDLYVADSLNHVIRRIAGGSVETIAGTTAPGFADGLAGGAKFSEPSGIAVDGDGSIVVADTQNHRIRRIDLAQNNVTTIAGTSRSGLTDGPVASAQFSSPSAVAVNGALWVADRGNDAVRVIYANVQVTSVSPVSGPAAGGNSVQVFGSGFVPGATEVRFGTTAATSVTFVSGTEVVAIAPAGTGRVDVSVTTPAGTGTLSAAYSYGGVLALDSITPNKAPIAGGITVTVTGSNFEQGMRLYVAGRLASNLVVVSPSTLTARLPSGIAGPVAVTVSTSAGEVTKPNFFTYYARPAIASFTPAGGFPGTVVTIAGSGFDADAGATQVSFGSVPAIPAAVTYNAITVAAPASFVTAPITVTTIGGTITSTKSFEKKSPLVSVQVLPTQSLLGIGEQQQFVAIGTDADGKKSDVSAGADWSTSSAAVATVGTTGRVSVAGAGTATITANIQGFSSSGAVSAQAVEPLPPAPATVATPIDRTVRTSLGDSMRFLFEGPAPIQRGVTPQIITDERISVVRGRVATVAGEPVAGVRVSAVGDTNFGYKLTRPDGGFDFATNGGGYVTLQFEKSGYPSVQRQFKVEWEGFRESATVLLTPFDSAATAVTFGAAAAPQVARGSVVSDADGQRRATILVPAGTQASMILPDGATQPIAGGTVRATEYTVGPTGPAAMPGELPATSGYTYAAEFSLDEAVAARASEVRFTQPVFIYLENFLSLPVGLAVPAGYYDRAQGRWMASENGRIIKVLSITGGMADLDLDGNGVAETAEALAAAGVTGDERGQLATLYTAGQSLWRVPVKHFTPWDFNFPFGPPAGAAPPSPSEPETDSPVDDPNCTSGSVIECENQILGESVAIAGTGMKLHYRSDRMAGRKQNAIKLHLSNATLPPNVKKIEVEIDVLGQKTVRSFSPQTNLTTDYQWDGRDGYGRLVAGRQTVNVSIGYTYDAVYQKPANLALSFGALSGIPITGSRARTELTLWNYWSGSIGHVEARDFGIGGWTLTEHHTYDRNTGTLFLGDGSRRSANDVGRVIGSAAGTAGFGQGIDEGMPHEVKTQMVRNIAIAPDGSIYFSENGTWVVRKVDHRTGRITRVAGVYHNTTFPGPGRPATETPMSLEDIQVGPDGLLYIGANHRILRVNRQGIIEVVAGNGTETNTGDGGRAVDAGIAYPRGLTFAPDGTLYLTSYGIRAISPDGYIRRVIATNTTADQGFSGDGGPASQAKIWNPVALTVGPDGALYFADTYNFKIRRIGQDGIITTVAGTGCSHNFTFNCYADMIGSGDGGPAKSALLWYPYGVGFDRSGAMYIGERWARTRRVALDGKISTYAGQLTSGFEGDGGPAAAAKMGLPLDIAQHPSGALFLAEGNRLRKIGTALPGFSDEEITIASSDGADLYVFDPDGRHLRTIDSHTGAVRYSFSYSGGRLAGITDASGAAMSVSAGSIVAPGGQTTTLAMNGDGYLSSITSPSGESVVLGYGTGGLLASFRNANGQTHFYSYDTAGRLLTDTNPAGGSKTLTRSGNEKAFTVVSRTLLGRATSHSITRFDTGAVRRVLTDPAGLSTITNIGADESQTITYPDGTTEVRRFTGDPRFGMAAPSVSFTWTTPGGRTRSESEKREYTLTDLYDPLSVQTAKLTSTTNGRSVISLYDVAARKVTRTLPSGRTELTFIDALSRPVRVEFAAFAPLQYTYDGRGLLTSFVRGSRTTTYGWNDRRELTSITDALSRTTEYTRDASGRIIRAVGPGNLTVAYGYDANGNLTSITPPGRSAHAFTYNQVNQPLTYVPPGADASGTTTYTYDSDGALTAVGRPGGDAVTIGYDAAGRPRSMTSRAVAFQYGYDGAGRLASITGADAGVVYGFDGRLLTSLTWSGAVAGSVGIGYDNDFRETSIAINGSAVTYAYDADGLLLSAGALTLSRAADSGVVLGTTLGGLVDEYSYNSLGEITGYTARYDGTPLLSFSYDRDAGGRITARTQTSSFGSSADGYTYDAAGRLESVSHGGSTAVTYGYDPNGNRISTTKDGATVTSTYDAQDRILTHGANTYTVAPGGELTGKSTAAGTTTYAYDGVGALRKVVTPSATIDYVLDGAGRRLGRKVGGVLQQGYLYDGAGRVVAELDGSGAVVSRFVYGWRLNAPDYMVRGGTTYRFVCDHLGSPRMIVDVATGTVAQYLQYDELGQITGDSNPGFQPFGFAGGLYDRDTKLTRFGVRDYDAETGRWTTKEPLGFAGGDTNFYAYVGGDPINFADPSGLAKLPSDPSGLGPEWKHDPGHKNPNGKLFRDPNGNVLEWHEGQEGKKGWRGKDHWHYRPGGKGGDEHLEAGDEIPDGSSSDDVPDNSSSCSLPDQSVDWKTIGQATLLGLAGLAILVMTGGGASLQPTPAGVMIVPRQPGMQPGPYDDPECPNCA